MKAVIASGFALVIGLLVGAFVVHRSYDSRFADEAVQAATVLGESFDRERAARAVRAIELIQSGRSDAAVELLTRAVADYYELYAKSTQADPRTRDVLAMIERLANTNEMVANAIHRHSP